MTIDLVFITYNRLDYTKLALPSVLADPTEEFSLTIWDNASTDGTVEYLKNEVSDPRISDIIFSKVNLGQMVALNEIWGKSKADLLGKLDNDCLLPPGWTRILAQAHADVPKFGILGCWHYFPDDFDYERAKHKIQKFGQHQVLRHPWTASHSSLVKRKAVRECGPFDPKSRSTTDYWIQMAAKGYINGYYYPLVYAEHMDDPKSKHSHLKDEASYQAAKKVTVTINSPRLETLADRWRWRDEVLDNMLDDPWDVKYYVGWRRKWRRGKKKLARLLGGGKP